MEKETAIQKVIEYIKNNIGMGVWPVGTKIPSENNICKLLNVSRTSVRSGMEPFVVLSIISCHQGKGKFIISTDLSLLGKSEESHLIKNPEDVRQSLEVRKIIEPSICKMIAPIISNETLNELKKVLSDMVTSVGKSKEFVKDDMHFHQLLCHATGNKILEAVLQPIFSDHSQFQLQLNKVIGYYGGVYYHTLLMSALEKHDGKQAADIMEEHLQRGIDDLDSAIQS